MYGGRLVVFKGGLKTGPWTKNGANCKPLIKNRPSSAGTVQRCNILFNLPSIAIEQYQFLGDGGGACVAEGSVSETSKASTSNFNDSNDLNGEPGGGFFPYALNPAI